MQWALDVSKYQPCTLLKSLSLSTFIFIILQLGIKIRFLDIYSASENTNLEVILCSFNCCTNRVTNAFDTCKLSFNVLCVRCFLMLGKCLAIL